MPSYGEPSRGIKSDSVLNKLKYYHVANPGLPPCLAHDMYEGVVQYDLMLSINYFIKKIYLRMKSLICA